MKQNFSMKQINETLNKYTSQMNELLKNPFLKQEEFSELT